MVDKIYIEKKEYKNRVELKIKIEGPYLSELNRKHTYHRYLAYWDCQNNCGGYVDYCFTVYKNITWLSKLIHGGFNKRMSKAMDICYGLIWEYKESQEQPKITKIGK